MVVVLDCHEAEGLQHTVSQLLHRAEDFRHAMHRSSLRLKTDFDEIALSQRLRQAQQASSHGDSLEFSFGAATIFEPDRCENGISQLDSGRAPRWVRLGEVSHRPTALSHYAWLRNRLLWPLVRIPHHKPQVGASKARRLNGLSLCLLYDKCPNRHARLRCLFPRADALVSERTRGN